jgi:predicted DNA binding CopG/RHH family protein
MTQHVEHATARESRIPDFASREEEAEWWDTHDVTDYLDELQPVKVHMSRTLSEGVQVRFDPETMAALRQRAREQGIGSSSLIRMWVLEKLRSDEQRHAS